MGKLDTLVRLVGVMADMESITEAWASEDGVSEAHKTQFASMIQAMTASYAIVHTAVTSETGIGTTAEIQMRQMGCDDPLEVVIALYYTALLSAFQMGRASVIQETE